jgi:hypothetical protein
MSTGAAPYLPELQYWWFCDVNVTRVSGVVKWSRSRRLSSWTAAREAAEHYERWGFEIRVECAPITQARVRGEGAHADRSRQEQMGLFVEAGGSP